MRLFIASPAVITDYAQLRRRFGDTLTGKWVEPHNLHLTWLFLGECDDVDTVIRRFIRIKPLLRASIPLFGLGTFGATPRILYADSTDKRLFAQAEAIETAGFSLPRFKPHVTLCRIKNVTNYKRFNEVRRDIAAHIRGEISPRITLYRSTLTPRGPHYTPLATLPAP